MSACAKGNESEEEEEKPSQSSELLEASRKENTGAVTCF
jgi:hypothetical protein